VSIYNRQMIITAITLDDLQASGIREEELIMFLPESSRKRLSSFLNKDSLKRSLLGELLSRYSIYLFSGQDIGMTDYLMGKKGKPFLNGNDGIHFNISHSGKLIVCAVAESDVGVDVEEKRKVNLSVAERFFSPGELEDLFKLDDPERMDYFFKLWTLKESFLKAIGSGLTRTLNSFTVRKSGNEFQLTGDDKAAAFRIKSYVIKEENYLAVCCIDPLFPEAIRWVGINELADYFVNR